MKPGRAVASFDSASTFLRVLAQHLHGKGSPALGLGPAARTTSRVLPVVNKLPGGVREALYTWSGWSEAVPKDRVGDVDAEAIAAWAAGQYPRRRYPAVLIGSSSGAVAHLAALAGVPWLPQTFLVPVRHRRLDPDEPKTAMADLEPGGTVLVVDCAERWPTTTIGPRELFQHGAVGDATPEEYAHAANGSPSSSPRRVPHGPHGTHRRPTPTAPRRSGVSTVRCLAISSGCAGVRAGRWTG